MILLTLNEWLGTHRDEAGKVDRSQERTAAFVTKLPLTDALNAIKQYEVEYSRRRPTMSLTFTLLSVTTIPDDTPIESLTNLGVELVEDLRYPD